jgi:hypothetical protein
MPGPELPLLVQWETTLGDLLDRTAKFPKSVRFTFSSRIDNGGLDVLERLVEARYATGVRKQRLLAEIDTALARLRVLLRLAHARKYLDHGGLEHVARRLDEAGRMLGGWRREQAGRRDPAGRRA